MEPVQILHEINNSLTAVNLTLEYLRQNSQQISPGELIQELAFSLQSLDYVSHVLRAADSTTASYDSEKFVLLVVIETVVAILKRKWPKFEPQLVNKTTNLEVYGSKTAMTQVFMNILSNAIESYGNEALERKLRVKITLKKDEKDGAKVLVQDWGRGVPTFALPHLFEEGFSLKKALGGKGIGLALCRKIIERQFHGQIKFKTRVGKGSVVEVRLASWQ